MNQKTCKDCIHHEVCKYVELPYKDEDEVTQFLTREEVEKALERMKEDEKNNI